MHLRCLAGFCVSHALVKCIDMKHLYDGTCAGGSSATVLA